MKPNPRDYGAIDEGVLPNEHRWVFDDEEKEKKYNDAYNQYESERGEYHNGIRNR